MSAPSTERYACITVDLDTLQCYRDIHGLEHNLVGEAGDPSYTTGLRRILDLFGDMGIPATLFVIGRDTAVPVHHELLEEADARGWELANHTHNHPYDLPSLSPEQQQTELARGEGAIASVTGRRPVGFRAPGYNVDEALIELCRSREYRYDSSIFPCPPYWVAKSAIMVWQRLRGRPSRSAQTQARNLLAPTTPYHPEKGTIWRRSSSDAQLLEVPMCLVPGVRFPVIGTSLHLLGYEGFGAIYPLLRRRYTSIINLEFHAIDFIDETDVPDGERLAEVQPDLAIPWSKKRALYVDIFNRLREDYLFDTLEGAVDKIDPASYT